ncbi:MAG: CinA family protein [Betaproteobacteria bacterium]|nr:MAG: CinA family protein [Betaproteobacteria bacterium]
MNEHEIESLAAQLGKRLLAQQSRVAAAESCTGGLVAGAITSIAGSSDWFDRGFVTYSNSAKRELLDVDESVLRAYGAVSEPTAIAMAEGALKRSEAALTVAITGIAGPGGGTPEKPVGMVCFAWARKGGATISRTHYLSGNRADVRQASVAIALRGLIDAVESASAR